MAYLLTPAEFPKNLNGNIKNFTQSGYADNIRYSHEGVDNHDKPRALHCAALDMDMFYTDLTYPENREKRETGNIF